jgi:hypothetical protein
LSDVTSSSGSRFPTELMPPNACTIIWSRPLDSSSSSSSIYPPESHSSCRLRHHREVIPPSCGLVASSAAVDMFTLRRLIFSLLVLFVLYVRPTNFRPNGERLRAVSGPAQFDQNRRSSLSHVVAIARRLSVTGGRLWNRQPRCAGINCRQRSD